MTSIPAAPPFSAEALPAAAPQYRRLVRQWWRWKFDEAWLAADHVLVVRTRFFRERYLRLYWADIAALLLFPTARNGGLYLAAEIICLLAAPLLVLFGDGPPAKNHLLTPARIAGLVISLTTVILYSLWRFTRRRWYLQIITLTGRAIVPLSITQKSSERYIERLRSSIEAAQPSADPPDSSEPLNGSLPESAEDIPTLTPIAKPAVYLIAREAARSPLVALHTTVFLLGIIASALGFMNIASPWYPLFLFSVTLFYLALPVLFFLQQDPEFPFTVRCAAVLNMAMAIGVGAGVATAFSLRGQGAWTGEGWLQQVNILRLVCCLFGIMALWKDKLDRDSAPLPASRESLGR